MALHPERPRLIPRTRGETVRRLNLRHRWWQDIYHEALMMSWAVFLLWSVIAYVLINALFAGLYLLQSGSIAKMRGRGRSRMLSFSACSASARSGSAGWRRRRCMRIC